MKTIFAILLLSPCGLYAAENLEPQAPVMVDVIHDESDTLEYGTKERIEAAQPEDMPHQQLSLKNDEPVDSPAEAMELYNKIEKSEDPQGE